MSNPVRITCLDRRDFIIGGSAAIALGSWVSMAGAQVSNAPARSGAALSADKLPADKQALQWHDAYRKIVGDAKPIEGRVALDIPALAENGNTVPISIAVESPMTDDDFVKAIHVFATANPVPSVATFRLTPQSGAAVVAGRIRLSESQDVVALAELSDGRFLVASRSIKVAIGGCGG